MQIFLDTAEVDAIRQYADWGVIDGVTTNPSLIAKSGRVFEEVITEICEIVDGVEEDVVELPHLRLDVPGYGDIHHEHGTAAPRLQGAFHHALAQDGQVCSGGGDENIGLGKSGADIGQENGFGAEALR